MSSICALIVLPFTTDTIKLGNDKTNCERRESRQSNICYPFGDVLCWWSKFRVWMCCSNVGDNFLKLHFSLWKPFLRLLSVHVFALPWLMTLPHSQRSAVCFVKRIISRIGKLKVRKELLRQLFVRWLSMTRIRAAEAKKKFWWITNMENEVEMFENLPIKTKNVDLLYFVCFS